MNAAPVVASRTVSPIVVRRAGRAPARQWHLTVVALIIMGLFLFPIYWMVNVSLQTAGGGVTTPFIPAAPSLSAYGVALADQSSHLAISLAVAIGTVLVSLLIAAPGAYALACFRLPWARPVLLILMVSQMIPSIVVANAIYSFYAGSGLLNSIPGLILADATLGVPFAMLILTTFMESIPPALLEASEIDGAGMLRTFWSIVLPMSRNSLVTAALFTFLFAWGDFLFALTLTTKTEIQPVTLSLYTYLGAYVSDWSAVMATAVLASLPAIVLLGVAQRFVAAGISAGAVK